jgi:hypothetical protein
MRRAVAFGSPARALSEVRDSDRSAGPKDVSIRKAAIQFVTVTGPTRVKSTAVLVAGGADRQAWPLPQNSACTVSAAW